MAKKYPANLIEDGQELALTFEHVAVLEGAELVHKCIRECGPNVYHINAGKTWEEVENCISKAMAG